LKNVTRREFFSELYSKDTLNNILGSWHSFNREVGKNLRTEISCDDAGFILGKKFRKNRNDSGKEG